MVIALNTGGLKKIPKQFEENKNLLSQQTNLNLIKGYWSYTTTHLKYDSTFFGGIIYTVPMDRYLLLTDFHVGCYMKASFATTNNDCSYEYWVGNQRFFLSLQELNTSVGRIGLGGEESTDRVDNIFFPLKLVYPGETISLYGVTAEIGCKIIANVKINGFLIEIKDLEHFYYQ